MKTLLVLLIGGVILFNTVSLPDFSSWGSIGSSSVDLKLDRVIKQNCPENNDEPAEVVLLSVIKAEHPLGENTCGELHSIEKIGLEGTDTNITIGQ